MIVLDILNKKGLKTDYKKTALYKELSKNQSIFKGRHVDLKIKSMTDVFDYEIIYKSILAENKLHNLYELFLTENYDILNYLNYDEKRHMVNNEFASHIDELDAFMYQNQKIIMPMYENHINVKLLQDYQIFELKQHKQYIENFSITKDNPKKLYGVLPYQSSFSSLDFIKETEGVYYFYFDPTHSIYAFKDDFINEFVITDIKSAVSTDHTIISEIIDAYANNNEVLLLETLHEHHLISDKLYNKISKKVNK